jgi:hypothetical protein
VVCFCFPPTAALILWQNQHYDLSRSHHRPAYFDYDHRQVLLRLIGNPATPVLFFYFVHFLTFQTSF